MVFVMVGKHPGDLKGTAHLSQKGREEAIKQLILRRVEILELVNSAKTEAGHTAVTTCNRCFVPLREWHSPKIPFSNGLSMSQARNFQAFFLSFRLGMQGAWWAAGLTSAPITLVPCSPGMQQSCAVATPT
jgi:hypothetical protein